MILKLLSEKKIHQQKQLFIIKNKTAKYDKPF